MGYDLMLGDCREKLRDVSDDSIALSVWSPPYFVGKQYEADYSFEGWQDLIRSCITEHFRVLRPGAFLAVNIADILCFRDESMPRIMATNLWRRSPVTREDVLKAYEENPGANRYQIAEILGCGEQTVDRRLNGNNIRGGKYEPQTRVQLVGGMVQDWASEAGLYLYDRRVWQKDAAWENSRWHTVSYRAVDEFEYVYLFWKPGQTTINRNRLSREEWVDWGSRAVWQIASVRSNDDHEAKFPIELPRRLIRLLTEPGDSVMDCFLGSGTSGLAALQLKRNFMGIAREPNYFRAAAKKLRDADNPATRFFFL
ncbi:MAG: site-specific DNA-methyltransferase [Planctomycetota bacterium]